MMIEVYSDGSSDGGKGKPGGWAFVIVIDGVKTHEANGFEQKATNNTMEILSATMGLEYIVATYPQCKDVTLISDSQLTLKFATKEYTVKKMHLLPYVLKLRKAYEQLNAKAKWVRGHSGNEFNEVCDKLAKSAREQANNDPQQSITEDYP